MIKLKIKKAFSGFIIDQVISVEVDSDGVPVDRFWRRRLRDSKVDGCVELQILKPQKLKNSNPDSSEVNK